VTAAAVVCVKRISGNEEASFLFLFLLAAVVIVFVVNVVVPWASPTAQTVSGSRVSHENGLFLHEVSCQKGRHAADSRSLSSVLWLYDLTT
jgi:hypothetical protein